MISKIEVERFSLTSSRPFDEVLASIKGAVGHPDMVEFAKTTAVSSLSIASADLLVWRLLVPSRVDTKCGDHLLQGDSPGLIRTMPNWISSESPTTHAERAAS